MRPNFSHSRPLYENDTISIRQTRDGLTIRQKQRWPPPRRPFICGLVLSVLLGGGGLLWQTRPWRSLQSVPEASSESFRLAVNRAMSAAELTQTAQSSQEWQTVAGWWQEAAGLMAQVPTADPNYELARSRVTTYQQNYQYAIGQQSKLTGRVSPAPAGLWQVGSSLHQVFAIQGEPDRRLAIEPDCREALYYRNSRVDLQFGIVVGYTDTDNILKVADVPLYGATVWGLGASLDQVQQVQGAPDQVLRYEAINQATVFYQNSFIDLLDDVVIGYHNVDDNLRVTTQLGRAQMAPAPMTWTLESTPDQILQIEGTPDRVEQEVGVCRTVFHYGNDFVEFRGDRPLSYANFERTLQVR